MFALGSDRSAFVRRPSGAAAYGPLPLFPCARRDMTILFFSSNNLSSDHALALCRNCKHLYVARDTLPASKMRSVHLRWLSNRLLCPTELDVHILIKTLSLFLGAVCTELATQPPVFYILSAGADELEKYNKTGNYAVNFRLLA